MNTQLLAIERFHAGQIDITDKSLEFLCEPPFVPKVATGLDILCWAQRRGADLSFAQILDIVQNRKLSDWLNVEAELCVGELLDE